MEYKPVRTNKFSGCICGKNGEFVGDVETRLIEIEQKIENLQNEIQFLQAQIIDLKV